MQFEKTELDGVYLIKSTPIEDHRGFFVRTFCAQEFSQQELISHFVQGNVSFNHKRGTLRGLHYQTVPYEEAKIVSCHAGGIYDVVVDIREKSPNYGRWVGVELTKQNHCALYIPPGFAHGFQTLDDDTEVQYLMSEYYQPSAQAGIHFADPKLAIGWPIKDIIISDKDKLLPNLPL